MGVGFKVQVKKRQHVRYVIGFMACVGLPPNPYQTLPLAGAGNARRLTIYSFVEGYRYVRHVMSVLPLDLSDMA